MHTDMMVMAYMDANMRLIFVFVLIHYFVLFYLLFIVILYRYISGIITILHQISDDYIGT